MLTVRLPGTIAPKMTCIMLVIWLIGPQFVSPSTRSPTSISGSDSRMATAVSHMAMPNVSCCSTIRAIASTIDPMTTHCSGNEVASARAPESRENVRFRMLQRSASAVRPPDTIIAVAGHITQNSTSVRVNVVAAMTP